MRSSLTERRFDTRRSPRSPSARPAATARLRALVDKATQATLVGDLFDDAATAQALLNFSSAD